MTLAASQGRYEGNKSVMCEVGKHKMARRPYENEENRGNVKRILASDDEARGDSGERAATEQEYKEDEYLR